MWIFYVLALLAGTGGTIYFLFYDHWGYALITTIITAGINTRRAPMARKLDTVIGVSWFVFIICKIAQFIFQ